MRFPALFTVLLVLLAPPVGAQEAGAPVPAPAPLVVMNLAAHPDDEDGATMAHYRFTHDAVVHSVIFTRGEGGQNEIGPQLYAELGALRTAETEAAARHLGTQVHFLNFDDFGFSKHAAETFERWGGEDAVVERLVGLIRRYRPDVLFTNHDTVTVGPRRQHGHHQVVGLAAVQAMRLAADPSYRPEQLAEDGVEAWQPQRLFLRLWRGGQDTAQVRVPVGTAPPGERLSAADRAVLAAAEHRSQGFDRIAERFRRDTTHFVLLAAAPGAPPLPPGATDLAAGLPPNPHVRAPDWPDDATLAHFLDAGRVPPLGVEAPSVVIPGGTVPFRLAAPVPEGLYLDVLGVPRDALHLHDDQQRGAIRLPADARPTLPQARAQYDRFENHPPLRLALLDRVGGVRAAAHLPTEVAPPLALALAEAVPMPGGLAPRVLLRPGENRLTVTGRIWAEALAADQATLRFGFSEGVGIDGRASLRAENGRVETPLTLTLPERLPPGVYPLTLEAADERLALEGHVLPEVALPEGLRIGFVRSYDGGTEAALREMGADVTPLDSTALAEGAFEGLHTIVVDIRAYLDRPDLRAHNDRLLDWVRRGGHLVVTYHKTMEWNPDGGENPDAAEWAPFPLRLGRDRVTDAGAAVEPLVPEHPLFHAPNPLGPDDWAGWVQERGLYFPATYADAYVELLAMSDPGEAPLRSSTLLAAYGDGTYLYTALGWYRQLGAFVPGAYRAFANLVSLPLVDGRGSPER